MASPFSVFRKNQKYWMAGLVVMAMIAFVFMPQSMMSSFRAGGGYDEPVVKTKLGKLTARQLDALRFNRLEFIEFLQSLKNYLDSNKKAAYNISRVMQVIGPADNENVVNKWLFAREAEAMGISVDDKTLSGFLGQLTDQSLDRDGILKVLRGVRQGVSEATFLSILREELLALRYRQVFQQLRPDESAWWIGGTATPDERWTAFKRMNEHATIEVALLKPEDFTRQVAAPDSPETLPQFFEKYKQTEFSPYLPNPGFSVPRKVNIEYLWTDEDAYRASVTDAEITQHYQKDLQSYARAKEDFEKQEKDEIAEREREDAVDKAAAEKKSETGKKPDAEKKPEVDKKPEAEKKPETGKKPEAEKKSDAEKKLEVDKKPDAEKKPEKPETGTAEPKPATDTKPAAAPNSNPSPKIPEPAKAAPSTKSSGSSSSLPRSPFRLVAFADDKSGEKAAQTKDGKKEPATQPATQPTPKPAEETKPVEGKKPADEKKPAEEKKPDAKSGAAETAKKDSGSKKSPRPPIKTADQRLREKIRDEIAQEKLQDQLRKIQTLLADYRKLWVQYDADAKSKPATQKPTPPDFGALAREYNMTADRTGLVAQYQLADLDVGKSRTQQRTFVAQSMFGPTTLYKPDESVYAKMPSDLMSPDLKRTYFVFWKTDDQPAHLPKWEDPGVQAEVLRAWKLDKARELAKARAAEMKSEAVANSGKSLNELASARKKDFTVKRPLPFSYVIQMYGQFSLGEVSGLEKVGEDFMKKVFALAPKQADIAWNQPQTEIYVVRAVEFTPFEELWSKFTSRADDWSIFRIYADHGFSEETAGLAQMIGKEQGEVWEAWLQKVKEDAGFDDSALKADKRADQDRRRAPSQSPGPSPMDEE